MLFLVPQFEPPDLTVVYWFIAGIVVVFLFLTTIYRIQKWNQRRRRK